jgi:hypothetical protein
MCERIGGARLVDDRVIRFSGGVAARVEEDAGGTGGGTFVVLEDVWPSADVSTLESTSIDCFAERFGKLRRLVAGVLPFPCFDWLADGLLSFKPLSLSVAFISRSRAKIFVFRCVLSSTCAETP